MPAPGSSRRPPVSPASLSPQKCGSGTPKPTDKLCSANSPRSAGSAADISPDNRLPLPKDSLPKKCLLAAIRFYQRWISPMFPPACRFYPTCSQYALEAVRRFGVCRGSWLAIKRILKCHPFHEGGYDPVPASGETKEKPE